MNPLIIDEFIKLIKKLQTIEFFLKVIIKICNDRLKFYNTKMREIYFNKLVQQNL